MFYFSYLFKFKVVAFKNGMFVVMLLLGQTDLCAAEHRHSNYVGGNAHQENSKQVQDFIDEHFFSYKGGEKKLDIIKMRDLQKKLRVKHDQLLDSFQQSIKIEFINRQQYSDKKSG